MSDGWLACPPLLVAALVLTASGLDVRRSKQLNAEQRFCSFDSFRNGMANAATIDASRNNVVFRSNEVLVVQDGQVRSMVFIREGSNCTGQAPLCSHCHEQAQVSCGAQTQDRLGSTASSTAPQHEPRSLELWMSSLQTSSQQGHFACQDLTPCETASKPELSYVRSMIGGALKGRRGGKDLRVASIGLGAGTIPVWFSRMIPTSSIDAVDISGDVIAAAPCFGVKASDSLQLVQQDGREYLASQPDHSYDIVFVDAFDNHDKIPGCLRTVQFFNMVKQKLRRGGVLSMNVWSKDLSTVYATLSEVFAMQVQIGTSPGEGNLILLASTDTNDSFGSKRASEAAFMLMQSAGVPEVDLTMARARGWADEAEFGTVDSRFVEGLRARGFDFSVNDVAASHDSDACAVAG